MSEESDQFLEQIRGIEEEEERLLERYKKMFIVSNICTLLFSFLTCLSIYLIASGISVENFIPILMACLVFLAMSLYYAISFGMKYYRQREDNVARRGRARVRLSPQSEEFKEESDSGSSPADSTDPAADGPSNLPQTESSTLSEQTSTQESSEKTSLSDSGKNTLTITAVIEHSTVATISADATDVDKLTLEVECVDEGSKPSTSSQSDSVDSLKTDVDPEDDIGSIRHRRPTPE